MSAPTVPQGVVLVLHYDYVEDVLERRGPHRAAHLDHGRRFKEQGLLVMAGALGDPPHTGMFVFATQDAAEVERYAEEDPYVAAGLIKSWRIEPWNVTI